MPRDVTATEQAYNTHMEHLLGLADVDCRRIPMRQVRALGRALRQDLGDDLSTGAQQLVQRASILGVLLENIEARLLLGQRIAIGDYVEMCNTQKRLLMALGLKRVPRDVTPTLGQLLHQDLMTRRDE